MLTLKPNEHHGILFLILCHLQANTVFLFAVSMWCTFSNVFHWEWKEEGKRGAGSPGLTLAIKILRQIGGQVPKKVQLLVIVASISSFTVYLV